MDNKIEEFFRSGNVNNNNKRARKILETKYENQTLKNHEG